MSGHGHGRARATRMARCSGCERFALINGDDLCATCRSPQERDIARLTAAWGRDLDLLSRFDAFCAARDRAA
jgi:hypothetical protein